MPATGQTDVDGSVMPQSPEDALPTDEGATRSREALPGNGESETQTLGVDG